MAILPYTAGTVTLANGSTTVTGVGTNWLSSGLAAGDDFRALGLNVRIASVDSNTQLTLAKNWPGASLPAGSNYEAYYRPDSERVLSAALQVLGSLMSGVVSAFAGLTWAADKLAYGTGAGTMALTDLTAHGRSILALSGGNGKFIRSTGAGTAVTQDIVGPVTQSGGIPTGAIVERGINANGEYTKFAGGLQICAAAVSHEETLNSGSDGLYFQSGTETWTFPSVFSSPPSVSAQPGRPTGAPWGVNATVGAASTSNMQYRIGSYTLVPSSLTYTDYLVAIGRWN